MFYDITRRIDVLYNIGCPWLDKLYGHPVRITRISGLKIAAIQYLLKQAK